MKSLRFFIHSILGLVLIFFAWGAAAASSPKKDLVAYRKNISLANKKYRSFDNLTAKMYYSKALELNPESYDAMLGVLRAYNDIGEELSGGNDPSAEGFYQAANDLGARFLEKFPSRPEAYFSLAVAKGNLSLFKGGRDKVLIGQDIERLLNRSIELDPKFYYSYIFLGVFYREVAMLSGIEKFFARLFFGKLPDVTREQAIGMIEKALELAPNDLYAVYEKGRTLDRYGRSDEARVWYEKFFQLPIKDHRQHYMIKQAKDRIAEFEKKRSR